MPRAIWSGSISFGLVNIPIKLYNAVSRKNVSFHQIDARTGARVKMQRVSAADGSEVPYGEIVKGYELAPDHYVLVEPSELESLDPEATRTIDIEEFIDLADIDPVFFDSAYYVAPVKGAEKPYRLLVAAMEDQEKVGIARFVMRTKQYLAALRAKDGAMVLSTMVYADELVPAEEIGELAELDGGSVSDRELTMAKQLIESLSTEFEPERFRDEYRDRVLELIERKADGEEVVVEAASPADSDKVVDLMAALEASVAAARTARGRHPSAADDEADDAAVDEADEEGEAPKKRTAKKKAAAKRSPAKKQAKKSA
jgi:DNA end-binding protein Ku